MYSVKKQLSLCPQARRKLPPVVRPRQEASYPPALRLRHPPPAHWQEASYPPALRPRQKAAHHLPTGKRLATPLH